MGIVYRVARVSGTSGAGAAGALKLVCDGKCTPEGEARFGNEQRALQAIRHPRIPRLLEAGKSREGYCYLVTELVPGIPITLWAKQRALAVGARLRLVADACTAVAHLHDLGLVHLDLKPNNLLVDANGRVHLLDLGEVRRLDAGSSLAHGQRALTARYAAPEQLDGRALTPATDVFALGRVAAELLAGGRTGRPRSHTAADPTVEGVLGRALRPNPERRYANARAFGTALRRGLRRLQGTDG
jgi:serine/threonine-protein kinase